MILTRKRICRNPALLQLCYGRFLKKDTVQMWCILPKTSPAKATGALAVGSQPDLHSISPSILTSATPLSNKYSPPFSDIVVQTSTHIFPSHGYENKIQDNMLYYPLCWCYNSILRQDFKCHSKCSCYMAFFLRAVLWLSILPTMSWICENWHAKHETFTIRKIPTWYDCLQACRNGCLSCWLLEQSTF